MFYVSQQIHKISIGGVVKLARKII